MNWTASVDRARNAWLAVVIGLCTATGAAQAPATDTTVRRLRFDATALRPGQYTYEMTVERDVGTTTIGTRVITAARSMYNGTAAWLLLETRSTEGNAGTDTLFADLTALRPIHWSSIQGQARLGAEFRADTAFGATSAPSGRRSMVAVVPTGTFVSSAMLESALRLLPLHAVWEDSATTLSVTLNSNAVLPTRLSVIGDDRVRVPAGTFECWVVAVHADAGRGLYWVTKRDPMVVRTVIGVPGLGGAQLVSALTRFIQ